MKMGDKITVTEKLKEGELIREETRNGSAGCFFSGYDDDLNARTFFTVALHVVSKDTYDPVVGRLVSTADRTVTGQIVAYTSPDLDTCLVQVEQGQVGLNPNSLEANHAQISVNDVWNPSRTLQRLEQAQSWDEQTAIKKETLAVSHLGATLASAPRGRAQMGIFDGVFFSGLLTKEVSRGRMTQRTTYAGDSGGPVFTQEGLLVGFIRRGDLGQESVDTEVVLASSVLTFFLGHAITLAK